MISLERNQSTQGSSRRTSSQSGAAGAGTVGLGSGNAGMRRSRTNLASMGHHHHHHHQPHARQRSFDHKPKRSQLSHSNLKQLSGLSGARSPDSSSAATAHHGTVGLVHSRKKGSSSALSRKGKLSATNLHRLPSEYEDEDDHDGSRDPKADSSWVSESEASTPGDSGPPSPTVPTQAPAQAPAAVGGQDLSSTPKASQPPSPVKPTSTQQQQQESSPSKAADASSSTAGTSTHTRSPSLARRRNRSTASLRSTSSVLSSKLMPLRTLAPAPLQPQVDKSFEAPSVVSSPAPPGQSRDHHHHHHHQKQQQQQQKSAAGLGLTSTSNESASSATLIHNHLPERQQQSSSSSQSDAHHRDTQSDLTKRLEAMAGNSNVHAAAAAPAQPPPASPHLSSQQPQQQHQQQPLKRSSPSASQVLTSGAWDMPHNNNNNQQRNNSAAQQQQNMRKRQSPLISKFISPSNQPRPFPLRSSWSGTMDTLTESPDPSQPQQQQQQQQRVQRSSSGNKPVSRTQQRLMMEKNAPPVMSAQNEPHYHPGSEVPCTTAHSQLIPPHAHQHHHSHHQQHPSSPGPPPSPGSDDRLQQQQQQQQQIRQQQQQQQLQQQHQLQHEQMLMDNEEQDHESQLNEPAHRARQVHSLKMWALAVVREAEKVDKEHDFVRRFHDPITESLSRVAQKAQQQKKKKGQLGTSQHQTNGLSH